MKNQDVTTGAIENVAMRILAEQNKLGKLQSLNVSVRNISEQKRKRMIQAGALSIALLASGGLVAHTVKYHNKRDKELLGGLADKKAEIDRSVEASITRINGPARKKKDSVKESWDSVEEAFFEKKLTIYVEAKYKYGTKVFEVFSATPEVIKSSQLDKKILNEVKASVNRLKNNGLSVREDITVEAYKEIKLATSLLEDLYFLL